MFHSHEWADRPAPADLPPVCPGCGAVAQWRGHYWTTYHESDCSWMHDTTAEGYG